MANVCSPGALAKGGMNPARLTPSGPRDATSVSEPSQREGRPAPQAHLRPLGDSSEMQARPTRLWAPVGGDPRALLGPPPGAAPAAVGGGSKRARTCPRCAGPAPAGRRTYIFMYRCTSAGSEAPSKTKSSTITFSVSLGLQWETGSSTALVGLLSASGCC